MNKDIPSSACNAARAFQKSTRGARAREALAREIWNLEFRLLQWISESTTMEGDLARSMLAVETLRKFAQSATKFPRRRKRT